MVINKFWFTSKEKDHSYVLIAENTLYKVKATISNAAELKRKLDQGKIHSDFVGLPFSYINSIEFRQKDKFLRLQHSSHSEDEIRISDPVLRKEIFDYIQDNSNPLRSTESKSAILKRIKRPLIALLVIIGLFLYVYSIATGIEDGNAYELVGGRGIGGIVLVLARYGTLVNAAVFSVLALIALLAIRKRIINNPVIYRLEY